MTIDEVAVLVDGLRLEDKAPRLDKVLFIPGARRKDLPTRLVHNVNLHPALDDIQRPGGKIVSDLVGGHHHPHRDGLARHHGFGDLQGKLHDRARCPLLSDLLDLELALQPLLGQTHVLLPTVELEHFRHHGVGSQKAVAAVATIVGRTVVIRRVSGCGVIGLDKGHVALAALDGALRIPLGVPVAGLPVVILVLQLHPTDAIDLLVDKLLVAARAVLRRLEHPLAQELVLVGVGSNEKITRPLAQALCLPLPEIGRGLGHDIVGVALEVRLAHSVTR